MDKVTDSRPTTADLLANLADERNSAALYRAIAELEPQPKLAEFYRRLAEVETKHAQRWEEQLRAAGVAIPPEKLTWRTHTLIWLARRLGVQAVLPTLATLEEIDSHGYAAQASAPGLPQVEQSHARLLRAVSKRTGGGVEGGLLAQMEGRHRSAGGNALRAAVLGANDGLVSNMSLVMGVAGADLSGNAILVTGFAGLLAGAISMALGEWISVQSSRELYAAQLRTEALEIEQVPEEEAEELALIYEARGLSEEQARGLAARIMADEATALQTLARDELGIDPEELGGSAWEAAITSFVLFAIGAIIPVAPFMFLSGITAVIVSGLLSALGLFAIGAAITLFTGRPVWSSGLRQVAFGLAAALVTYGIGRMIGVSVGG
jgi:VIT1/CCC1 family predicted Fe2+/Mn2+ transporter